MPTSQYNFLTKFYQWISFFKSKIGNCKIFENPLGKFLIFSEIVFTIQSRQTAKQDSKAN